jgi:hypothetical protein
MVRLGSRKPEMPPDAPACAAVIVISFLLQIFYSQQQTFLALRLWCVGLPLVLPIPSPSDAQEQASAESPKTRRLDYSTTRSALIEAVTGCLDKISHAIVTADAGALGM